MFLETNHPKGTRVQFPGVYCQGAIIFGVIFQEQSSREQLSGGIVWGQIFLQGNYPRGQFPGGQSSMEHELRLLVLFLSLEDDK